MADWESAERVQKNEAGEYRALIGGEWIPVAKAQKNESGQFRIMRTESQTETKPFIPSGERGGGGVANITLPESIMGHPLMQLAVASGEPVLGAYQLLQKTGAFKGLPELDIKQIQEMQKKGGELYGGEVVNLPARVTGSVLSPVYMRLAQALPATQTIMQGVGQGAGIGALAGALTPTKDEDFWSSKGMQTGLSALFSGAASGGTGLLGAAYKKFIEPIVNRDLAAGRVYNEAAGAKAPQVINALRNPQQIVPGSVPTAGQAATDTGATKFAALQKQAEAVLPDEYLAREQAQNAARLGALKQLGSSDIPVLEAARTNEALFNYGRAYAQQIRADPQLAVMAKNPYFKDALGDATKLAAAKGVDPKQDLTQFLQLVKESLDKQLMKHGSDALGREERKVVRDLKNALVNWIGNKNPLYDVARQRFRSQSEPINQAQVGQYLEEKLVPAISDEAKQRAGIFAEAVRNAPQTIKKATGQTVSDELKNILNPAQLGLVNSVKKDLERSALFEMQAQKGMKAAPDLSHSVEGKLPSILERQVVVANTILGRLEKAINKDLAAKIAVQMLDDLPGVATKMENAAQTQARRALLERIILGGGAEATISEAQR